MGLARARDVLVKTSIPASTSVRFGVAASVLGMAISWPNEANADVIDAPPHRVEFTVSPGLPKCNDYDAFYGILVNWVRIRSIDPTANRKLVVAIKRQPDGMKRVDLAVLDPEGGEVAAESHGYSATEECFKVLYWTAFDAAKLLRMTIPPPVEEPPPPIGRLLEEAEKGEPVRENRPDPPKNWPGLNPDGEPTRRPCETKEEAIRPPRFVVLGAGLTGGLTRTIMPGLRLGVGRVVGPVLFEVDAHVLPPLVSADWSVGANHSISARAQAYFGSFAVCAHRTPLIACGVMSGGVSWYSYDKPMPDSERFAKDRPGGFFYMGVRTGFEIPLRSKYSLRFDVDAQFPLYRADLLQVATSEQNLTAPMLMGFVSFMPSF